MADDVEAPVRTFFGALAGGDFDGARDAWDADGTWHVQGHHELAGDYPRDDYLDMLRRWFQDFPHYTALEFHMERFGSDVVLVHLCTVDGQFDGVATGLMIFRVAGGLITEGWAIPTFAGGAFPF